MKPPPVHEDGRPQNPDSPYHDQQVADYWTGYLSPILSLDRDFEAPESFEEILNA